VSATAVNDTQSGPLGPAYIGLLDVEPALAAAIPQQELAAAHRILHFPTLTLRRGDHLTPQAAVETLAALIIDGLLVRELTCGSAQHAALLGPEDIADIREVNRGVEHWWALQPASVVLLDSRLLLAARQWPALIGALTNRLFDAARSQDALKGLLYLPHVESRLLALFAHYADRWGRMTARGVAVDLPLTHELLGRLVGAKRPTITLALGTLIDQGKLARDQQGRWLLPLPPRRLTGPRTVQTIVSY
jgi:CRP/FNR family transcriptional regulator, cyclic AMP receptor protein